MDFIWEDFENEQEKIHEGISKTKGFRYPPVLPIVFYDGIDNWTAATSLHERVMFSDILGKYIPDYRCMLIQLKEYSNAELMKKRDELSLLMMIDKLGNAEDYEELRQEWNEPLLKEVIKDSPEYLLKIMSQVIRMFLSKLNVPQEEADAFTEQVKENKMSEWKFENGIEVYESEYDYDLHCLKVYNGEEYLGTVYPASIEDMEKCFDDLDDGYDPITGGWEDGLGNICTLDGWGGINELYQ